MRIKINTNSSTTDKLIAVSCKLSAFKKLSAKSFQLAAFRKLTAKSYKLTATKGFTLVELLVTLSLFVVLTTIVLFSQQKFNGSILLTNLAYDVALTVRQAQSYGVNVREDVKENQADEKFQHAYGVHFETARDKQLLLFSDSQNNGKYGGGWNCKSSADSCVNQYSIKRGNYISDIRIINSDTGCTPTDGGCSVNQLDITFLRPDPDARFVSSPTKQNITEAKIIISSADGGNSRNVLVNSTGQISIGRGTGIVTTSFYTPFSSGNCTDYCGSIGGSCVSKNPWSSGICPYYPWGTNRGNADGANTTWCHTFKSEWGNPGGDITSCNGNVTSGVSDRRVICGCQN